MKFGSNFNYQYWEILNKYVPALSLIITHLPGNDNEIWWRILLIVQVNSLTNAGFSVCIAEVSTIY